jgi:hypothetical protein
MADAGSELVQFSPSEELRAVDAVIAKNMQGDDAAHLSHCGEVARGRAGSPLPERQARPRGFASTWSGASAARTKWAEIHSVGGHARPGRVPRGTRTQAKMIAAL